VNDSKIDFVVAKVKEAAARFKEPKIACLGLSYKPDIDDLRESPAVKVVEKLIKQQLGKVLVVEPYINELPPNLKQLHNIALDSIKYAVSNSDIVVKLVNHRAFQDISKKTIKNVFLDTTE
jgi:UDP-N-acetyl-D-mannosaminuronic acid dehydrogenase